MGIGLNEAELRMPLAGAGEARDDLSGSGILTPARVDEVVRAALAEVILPGLRSFEIVV